VRLQLMRLLSALLAAGTVLCVFMFLRELMPGSPWTWTVGALAVAFQPTFNFIAAGVHGDNLLFFTVALTMLLLTRAYRRGLTVRRGVLIGAVVAAGLLSKLTFIALVPGIALALALLAWRAAREDRRTALRALSAAVLVAAAPVALYALLNVIAWGRGSPTAGGLAGATNSHLATGKVVSLNETLDYTWELFAPRLWFMHHAFFVKNPLWQTWFNGSIGRFGWLDYTFPKWVYDDARYLLYVLLALAVAGVVRARAHVRALAPLFVCFAVMLVGLIGAIGYAGIRYVLSTGYPFEQARYLFALVPLYGLFIALAARGGGRRWGPAIGAALVVLAMAHGLFAETLTISRYYG
jgi:4-amino-4-deoxy-L-arabinose transferase-like glycosyltransferase